MTDLNYYDITEGSFTARWHDPQQDPQCVHDFQVSVSDNCNSRGLETNLVVSKRVLKISGEWHSHHQTNLTCDTCYDFAVAAVSSSGLEGPPTIPTRPLLACLKHFSSSKSCQCSNFSQDLGIFSRWIDAGPVSSNRLRLIQCPASSLRRSRRCQRHSPVVK